MDIDAVLRTRPTAFAMKALAWAVVGLAMIGAGLGACGGQETEAFAGDSVGVQGTTLLRFAGDTAPSATWLAILHLALAEARVDTKHLALQRGTNS